MGIEYSAKLLVGLPHNELIDEVDDVAGWCEENGLVYASPYYDAPPEHWVIGVEVARTDDFDWVPVYVSDHKVAHDKFKEITGMDGKLILSTHGY